MTDIRTLDIADDDQPGLTRVSDQLEVGADAVRIVPLEKRNVDLDDGDVWRDDADDLPTERKQRLSRRGGAHILRGSILPACTDAVLFKQRSGQPLNQRIKPDAGRGVLLANRPYKTVTEMGSHGFSFGGP